MTDKTIKRLVTVISIFVFAVVVILNRKVLPVTIATPSFVYFLPKLNAILNGTCSVLLLVSLYFITNKNVAMHKRLNIITFILSSGFLVSYILFHYFVKETTFGGTGAIRLVYYTILISHIILAAAVLPLVLLSFNSGLKLQVDKHRKLVRWTFPIWLYVTVTGVIVYIMIAPYYTF